MRSFFYIKLLAFLFALLQLNLGKAEITGPPAPKTQVMVVGTHYLSPDILKPNRQREIQNLAESLVRFRADKVVVDVPYQSSWESSLNQTYQTYLDLEYIPNRTAREQIGFLLAKMSGLRELRGIDISSGFDLGSSLREVSMNGETEAVDELIRKGKAIARAKTEHAANQSVSQYLSYLNHPLNLEYEHGVYVKGLSRLGNGQSQVGAHLLSQWYEYHMQLFANLTHMVDRPGERIVVLIESSHIPIFKQLIEDDPEFEWVDPLPYLEVQ